MIICQYVESKEIVKFKNVKSILKEINRDRSEDWTPYTKHDWKEGFKEWCYEMRIVKIIKGK